MKRKPENRTKSPGETLCSGAQRDRKGVHGQAHGNDQNIVKIHRCCPTATLGYFRPASIHSRFPRWPGAHGPSPRIDALEPFLLLLELLEQRGVVMSGPLF